MGFSQSELGDALRGDQAAIRRFVNEFTPIIRVRIGRVLMRCRSGMNAQQIRLESEDLCQETLIQLFDSKAKVLNNWDGVEWLMFTKPTSLAWPVLWPLK